ncbi:MAG: dihydroneopterin aldolase [Prevotella sp.]|nr:dihydroneopterin aldolase [Prevotella sp.]
MQLTESFILLKGLRFHAFHGVLPQEHAIGNDYTIDLRIGFDATSAAVSDEISDTLNYAEVYQAVKSEMNVCRNLIEHVAHHICKRLFNQFEPITSIDITLTKHNPPMGANCEGCAVEMHYKRQGT